MKILYKLYLFIVIISLIVFIFGIKHEIKHNPEFVDKLTCNITTYNQNPQISFVNGSIKDTTIENNQQCKRMETLTNKSNNLIYLALLVIIYNLRKDFYEVYKMIREKIEIVDDDDKNK